MSKTEPELKAYFGFRMTTTPRSEPDGCLSESDSKSIYIRMGLYLYTRKPEKPELNPNGYPNTHAYSYGYFEK